PRTLFDRFCDVPPNRRRSVTCRGRSVEHAATLGDRQGMPPLPPGALLGGSVGALLAGHSSGALLLLTFHLPPQKLGEADGATGVWPAGMRLGLMLLAPTICSGTARRPAEPGRSASIGRRAQRLTASRAAWPVSRRVQHQLDVWCQASAGFP